MSALLSKTQPSNRISNSAPAGYLSHVDGLRTFAVLSVFLFHLESTYLSGGFLGVDVFFVISGFLITRILKNEAEAGRLNAADFYARRVRRLFPALLVVITFSFLAGTLRYSPDKLVELANSGLSAILSVSNFYFYFNNDYFDAAAENQIFLHTWTLAVEEQFYLIWPLVIFLLIKYLSKSWQTGLIIGVCFLGSIISYLGTQIDTSLAFYMMPFRIAEFGLGALLCWLPGANLSQKAQELLVLIAMGAMLASFCFISDQYLFPGLWFLIPCIATSILIYFGGNSSIATAILANPVSTYIGRISYSLYLFHWPLIVLFKNEQSAQLSLSSQATVAITAVILAIVTYHLVEHPLRKPGTIWPTNRATALSFGLALAVLTLTFRYVDSQRGFPSRIPAETRQIIGNVQSEKSKRFQIFRSICKERGWNNCSTPIQSKPNIFILGDSHGVDALNILQPLWPSFHFIMYSENSCPPMTLADFDHAVSRASAHYEKCMEHTKSLSDGSLSKRADMVVVSSRYSWYTPKMLDKFLASLDLPRDTPVIVFGQAPSFSKDLPEIIYRHHDLSNLDAHAAKFLDDNTWQFDENLKQVAMRNNAIFIAKAGHFCDRNNNRCQLFHGNSRKLLTYDSHHLSFDSALTLGKWVTENLPNLPKEIETAHIAKK